jgi:hypothetical protein
VLSAQSQSAALLQPQLGTAIIIITITMDTIIRTAIMGITITMVITTAIITVITTLITPTTIIVTTIVTGTSA